MARTILTSIVVYPETLFDGDGVVRRWCVGLTAELKSLTKSKAPPRRSRAKWQGRRGTGALQRSIRGETARTGPLQNVSVVSVNVYYAKWVLGGTAAQGRRFIYSDAGWVHKDAVDVVGRRKRKEVNEDWIEMGLYMRLPLSNVGGGRVFHLRVHGQRANNFMIDGYNELARVHRALKPMANRFAF